MSNRNWFVRFAGVSLCAAAFTSLGCSAEAPESGEESVAQVGAQPAVTYEEWRSRAVWNDEYKVWTVEGDILAASEESLRKIYDSMYTPEGALTVNLRSGADDIWSRTNRRNLTYCVSQATFGSVYAQVVDEMMQAAAAWENVANVRFIHLSQHDSNCTASNNSVKFNVSGWNGGHCQMGFPGMARADRQLLIDRASMCGNNRRYRIGLYAHELGHGLGFRHEHERVGGTGCTGSNFRTLTNYDSLSVMHYENVCGSTNDTGALFITQKDADGASSVYEAPTNVVDTPSQVVYARKVSDGRIFKKVPTGWAVVGSARRSIVTVGETLYGLAGNQLFQYSGSGTTWNMVPGATSSNEQIFACAGVLCATQTDGSIRRFGAGSWSTIGSAGAKFQSVQNGQLFALDPKGNTVNRWNGSGTSWTNVGSNGFADLFSTSQFIFGITRDRNTVQVHTGGTSWVNVGGAGRQWHGAGTALYGLVPNASAVFRYLNGSWAQVGGAAARLYGSNGILYATDPNTFDIFSFNGSTWTLVGQP